MQRSRGIYVFSWLIAVTAIGGCGTPQDAIWLEGGSYGWVNLNHRLSHLTLGVDDQSAQLSVIGGTSTTAEITVLPDGCDMSECQEFPVFDDADIGVSWARVSTKKAVFGVGEASIIANAEGSSTSITIPLGDRGKGDAIAVLQSISLDTDHPISGDPNCYYPKNGWHPRRIAVLLEEPTLSEDGMSVTVEVEAAFEAGESLETVRQCIDEVNDRAQVPFQIRVLAAVGSKGAVRESVTHSASYEHGSASEPVPQPEPDLSQRGLDLGISDPLAGWSALDYRFHVDDPDSRGAYPRTFTFGLSTEEGWASGHSSNYSPGTQLSGFDYSFSGTVSALDVGGGIERGTVAQEVPAELDEQKNAIIHTFPLE